VEGLTPRIGAAYDLSGRQTAIKSARKYMEAITASNNDWYDPLFRTRSEQRGDGDSNVIRADCDLSDSGVMANARPWTVRPRAGRVNSDGSWLT